MSDIENVVVDNFKEHKFHRGNTIIYAKNCSECYKEVLRRGKEKLAIINIDTALMSERSMHPQNNYW